MRSLLFWLLFALPLVAKEIVAVSIPPQKFILDKIAQDKVEGVVLLPKGASPATFAPKPSTIVQLKKASLYLTIGVPFEKRVTVDIKRVDMGKYLQKESNDPHFWLSPPHLLLLGRVVLEELIKLQPSNASFFLKNYLDFTKQLLEVDSFICENLKCKERAFLTYHPSFTYFAKVYHLEQLNVEQEGKEPKPKELIELIKKAKEKGIKVVVVEPQFPTRKATFLAKQLGAEVVVINPLEYNILSTLEKLVTALSR